MLYRFGVMGLSLLLCCLVAVFAYLARTPLCIDSKLVEKIDAGNATIYSCSARKHIPYDAFFAEKAPALSKRFERLQTLTTWLRPLDKQVHIQIVSGKTDYFEIDGHRIQLSLDMLATEGSLEKGIIKIWLRETLAAQDPLIEEFISDLYVYALSGELFVDDKAKALWPRVLQNMSGYCQSAWRSFEHTSACARLNLQSSSDAQSVALLSLRPMLSQILISSYENMKASERLPFLKHLPEMLAKNPLVTLKKEKGIPEAAQFILSFNESVKAMSLQSEVFTEFQARWLEELKSRGFSETAEFSWVDAIFFLQDKNAEDQLELLKDFSRKERNLVSVATDSERIWLLPQFQPIAKSGIGHLKSMRGVLLNCGPLSTHKILKLETQVQKLLVIDACAARQANLDYKSYFKNGAEGFARANKEIAFMSIHIPSLRMALLRSGSIPMELTSTEAWQLIQKQASYDAKLKAYQVKGDIDSFDWFRK